MVGCSTIIITPNAYATKNSIRIGFPSTIHINISPWHADIRRIIFKSNIAVLIVHNIAVACPNSDTSQRILHCTIRISHSAGVVMIDAGLAVVLKNHGDHGG